MIIHRKFIRFLKWIDLNKNTAFETATAIFYVLNLFEKQIKQELMFSF